MNETIDVKEFVEFLGTCLPEANFSVQERTDGTGHIIYGPFPTLMFLIGSPHDPDGYMISVNADASLMVLVMAKVLRKYPHLVHFGPYCEDIDGNGVHLEPAAIEKQHALHMLRRAMLLSMDREGAEAEAKGAGLILPPNELVLPK
ncbi:hypothetical protein [Ralstonia phage RSP15]|uniref:hypothetical protein n=1 Tax=Ralstonia phage RSP15 TaxID=1785960 RepID=UPI00074D4AA9|nr:hypothetical protein BH754_gp062 [Ralstonia phage RSP15]BAU40020.1 hypothetical protein [Ralstonia phage RSP15]